MSKLEKEYLFRFHKIFQQLLTLNTRYGHIKDLKVLKTLFRQLLQNEKLAFQGEPLVGLQLMGMLETRALDFNTVLITSVNYEIARPSVTLSNGDDVSIFWPLSGG